MLSLVVVILLLLLLVVAVVPQQHISEILKKHSIIGCPIISRHAFHQRTMKNEVPICQAMVDVLRGCSHLFCGILL